MPPDHRGRSFAGINFFVEKRIRLLYIGSMVVYYYNMYLPIHSI